MHPRVGYSRVLHYRLGPKLRGRTYTFVHVTYLDVLYPVYLHAHARSRVCGREFAGRARPRFRERGRAPRSRLSRSSPDATSQYRVSRSAELVSDLCQSRASSLSLSPFLSLSISPFFSISSLSLFLYPGFPSRCNVFAWPHAQVAGGFRRVPRPLSISPPRCCAPGTDRYTHVRGAAYTYSNTVLQWSYQWGKQKLVCKWTCLAATVVHHVLDRTAAAGATESRECLATRRERQRCRFEIHRTKGNKWSIGVQRPISRSISSHQRSPGP